MCLPPRKTQTLVLLPWLQVWDYVYLEGPEPVGSRIPAELLQTMRREFQFWCEPPRCRPYRQPALTTQRCSSVFEVASHQRHVS